MQSRAFASSRRRRKVAAAIVATFLASAVMFARSPAAQETSAGASGQASVAPHDGQNALPPEIGRALLETKQATKRYRADLRQQISSSRDLIDKTSALLDRLGPAAAALPNADRARDAMRHASPKLRSPSAPIQSAAAPSDASLKQDLGVVASAAETATDVIDRTFAPTHAIVVSGGVSMGSYQAGFLYYYARALRFFSDQLTHGGAQPRRGRFQIATGASAGSINSFLAALDGCRDPVLDPERSLFFQTWNGIGLEQLIPSDPKPSSDGLFSQDAFTGDKGPLKLVENLWTLGQAWPTVPCETALGITATRLAPRRVDVVADPRARSPVQIHTTNGDPTDDGAPVLGLDRMTEKFLLTMSSKGDGTAPTFASRRIAGANDRIYPTLGQAPSDKGPDQLAATPQQIVDLLLASSAFPLAFSPKLLPVTTWTGGDPKDGTYDPNARFTDGGFLDNTPLRIAQKLAAPDSTGTADKTPPKAAPDDGAPRPRILLLMSSAQSWKKSVEHPSEDTANESVLGRYLPFVFNFLSTASDGSLIDVFEDDAGTFKYDIPMRPFPVAADPLGHFFAFAEPSFRTFDFYMGMVDAEELISGRVSLGKSQIPFEPGKDVTLECFRDYRRSARLAARGTVPKPGEACRQVDTNLTALLQASADRRWNVQPDDDDLEQFTAALKKYHFHYRELAHDKELTPTGVALALRATFDRLGTPFARAQPDDPSEIGVSAVAPVVTDLWRYRARTYLGVGIPGDASLQLVFSQPLQRWRRLSLRAEAGGFFSLYPRKTEFTTPDGMKNQSRYPMQLDAGLAAEIVVNKGVLFEIGANYAPRTEIFFGDGIPYLIQGVEGHLTLTLGERLFINLAPSYFFGGCAGNNGCAAIRSKYAAYSPNLVTPAPYLVDNSSLRLSAGWRILW
jgi:hypothetical protein